MKKFLIGLLIVIMLLVLLLPYFVGQWISTEFKQQLVKINKDPDQLYVTVMGYQTHWLSTDVQLLVKQPMPRWLLKSKPDVSKTAVHAVQLHIYHGPFALVIDQRKKEFYWGRGIIIGSVKLINPSDKDFSHIQGLNQPIQMVGHIDISGNLQLKITSDAYQITLPSHLTIHVVGTQTTLTCNNLLTRISGETTIDTMTLNQDALKIKIPPSTVHFTGNLAQNAMSQFKIDWFLPQFQVIDAHNGKRLVFMQHITIDTDKKAHVGMINATMTLHVSQIKTGHYFFKQVKAELQVDHLNEIALNSIRRVLSKVALLSEQKQFSVLKRYLPSLLSGVNIHLKTLQGQTPVGYIELSGQMEFPVQLPNDNEVTQQIQTLLGNAQGSLKIDLPANLLALGLPLIMGPGPVMPQGYTPPHELPTPQQSFAAIVLGAYQEGYFVKHDNRLVSELIYDKAQIIIKSQPTHKIENGINVRNIINTIFY